MEATKNQSAILASMLVVAWGRAEKQGQTSVAHMREFRNWRRPLRHLQGRRARKLSREFRAVTAERWVVNGCTNPVPSHPTPAVPIKCELLTIPRPAIVKVAPKYNDSFWRRLLASLVRVFDRLTTRRLAFK